jgi:coenzyme F420-dependent glucose-6-phosphate dehydrogenase
VEAFRCGGGGGKPLFMQVGLNWAATEQEALQGAYEQGRYNVLGGEVNWELRSPSDFETATRFCQGGRHAGVGADQCRYTTA